ncbi:hypothetical protein [Leekyejoonella antrihumi]|uniref:hypothetical protein n=1 Tax=Leekyejoonella antrihumi TaxID=1660198 RepID=UPI001645CB66|nr:hypothetical protein [Leekyejoonella antrihumi]
MSALLPCTVIRRCAVVHRGIPEPAPAPALLVPVPPAAGLELGALDDDADGPAVLDDGLLDAPPAVVVCDVAALGRGVLLPAAPVADPEPPLPHPASSATAAMPNPAATVALVW